VKLWLDDIRPAPDDSWVIARSHWFAVHECRLAYRNNDPITFISFDHDLGPDQPSGMDFAKYISDGLIYLPPMFSDDFDFEVHSANPCGAENIRSLINNSLKFRAENYAASPNP
jgi:hypothetical protein